MFLILSLFISLCGLFYFYRRRKLRFFEEMGVVGPEPNFLFGNLLEMRTKPFHELMIHWANKYGKFFGYYEGPTPNLVIGDPDLLQEVMIKQFSNFHGRKMFPMQSNPDKEERVSMFLARGKRWKRLRSSVNPAFSESKMRGMFPLVDECIESFMTVIDENKPSRIAGINIQEFLQRLTMDIICKCAFGIDINSQKNINNPFIVCLKRFLGSQGPSSIRTAIVMTFMELKPILVKIFTWLNRRPSQNIDLKVIRQKLIEVIEIRKKSSEKRTDLLQLLLDAEVCGAKLLDEENLCPVSTTIGENVDEDTSDTNTTTTLKNIKSLTTEEVISQANLFLFAGYETSSTAMSYTVHLMAVFPNIQHKLQKEIDSVFETAKDVSYGSRDFYDSISKLPYLNAVVYEVLRFYPFASTVVNRLCMKGSGTYLSNGKYIPNNLNIIPNVFALHQDSDVWTGSDPSQFVPERFLQEDGNSVEFVGPPHPLAWIPFGAGPRNCIGQRFALMVVKTTLARFFHQYEVIACDKTENPLQIRVGFTLTPKNGVHVVIRERNKSFS